MTELEPQFVNGPTATVDARELRQPFGSPAAEGVMGYPDLLVTNGAGLSVDVAAGDAMIRGDSVPNQGLYRVNNDAGKNSANFAGGGIPAANGASPRLDQIVARMYDTDHDASGLREWRLEVVAGVATPGATLDNRSGAAALPNSAIPLADLLIGAGAVAVGAGNIRDRRPYAWPQPPGILTKREEVLLDRLPGMQFSASVSIGSTEDLKQKASAVYLPKRIVNANRIRWRYGQGSPTATTGTYVIGLYDASGRKIVDTGAVALTGATGTLQERAEVISAVTLEAGVYFLMFGVDWTAGNSFTAPGYNDPTGRNQALSLGSGGTTAPQTLLGFADEFGAASYSTLRVPVCSLSVG